MNLMSTRLDVSLIAIITCLEFHMYLREFLRKKMTSFLPNMVVSKGVVGGKQR